MVIAVLSLLDRKPRSAFTPNERYELAEFSKKLVQELDSIVDMLTDSALRTTPLLERDSIINGVYKPTSAEEYARQFSTGKIEPELMPCGLQYRPKPAKNTRHPINTQMNFARAEEPTPPPSAESNNSSWYTKPQNYGRSYEQFCEGPVLHDNHVYEQRANSDYRCSSPRPFSGSDLTSLRPPPFNSPDVSFEGADSSRHAEFANLHQQFHQVSDTDCADAPADTSLGAESTVDGSSTRTEPLQQKARSTFEQTIEDFATKCHFDVVYCMELKSKPSPTGTELSYDIPLLYGHKRLATLDIDLHLNVLRSDDCRYLPCKQTRYERDVFADGFLIPLHPKIPRKQESAGLVLGMFRKPRTLEKLWQRTSQHIQQEKQEVIDFASQLSRVFPPSHKHSRTNAPRHNFEPRPVGERSTTSSSEFRPFLANEATELILGDENIRSGGVCNPYGNRQEYPSVTNLSTGVEDTKQYPRRMEVVPPRQQNSNTLTGKIKGLARDLVAETIGSLGKGGVA